MELNFEKPFIESQFPISKISKESYKERKAGAGQTLTGLGKWWGRKPLILVRSTLLGLLMPTSDDPINDRNIFLKILSMDEKGLLHRKNKSIPIKELYKYSSDNDKKKYFTKESKTEKTAFVKGLTKNEKDDLQIKIFKKISYDEKLKYCMRPEELTNLDEDTWKEINNHLKTDAKNYQELFQQLGEKKFGHTPKVGDCFCGGGSIPFEAARMGCDVYASDLNPVAGLLTWSSLNILSKSDKEIKELKKFQKEVFDEVEKQILDLGIETNELGYRAKYYLYCNETKCPECGAMVPLAPSFVVSEKQKTIGILKYNENLNNFDIEIKSNASKEEMNTAKTGTLNKGRLECPHCNMKTPIAVIRNDRVVNGKTDYGLRLWEKDEFIPRSDDVFQERLYCIGWMNDGNVIYYSPDENDLLREQKVIDLLKERFNEWQNLGYIPSMEIEEGYNTTQVIRERGWKYWHQLYNPRQLLVLGLFSEKILQNGGDKLISSILGFNRVADRMSKLAMWHKSRDESETTFSNQALNTLYVYAARSLASINSPWSINLFSNSFNSITQTELTNAKTIDYENDIWITDPPYADAINYHELTELFLSWDKKMLEKAFPSWYTDSKRALAVRGTGKTFNETMIDIYSNLAKNMPEDGMQVIMFTHQDVGVWAELAGILWLSGLHVVSAWNIATETESGGLKSGNYVKGTVILTLKKRKNNETVFEDEILDEVKKEVRKQIKSMKTVDDKDEPNFADPDYILAAYAASLKVLTAYENIEGIDLKYELTKEDKTDSPLQDIINKAIGIAYDCLIPVGFDKFRWKGLSNEEKFYIKGLESEINGANALSTYQELARGYGIKNYKDMLENTRANSARLKTASEYANKGLSTNLIFSNALLRKILLSIYKSKNEEDAKFGKSYLREEYGSEYWSKRNSIVEILDFICSFEHIDSMKHWEHDVEYAKYLRELIKEDSI
ncbi:anti-phage-associated DUF1156 domain-containing protein [Methanococcus maripaludis]|uniref:anti-phage-associated DUF1156 domain-containing protein n=1 Tax=Methanococcus maripaludis TaxID=39152 RepID=UPI000B2B5182|nr:anti-phage-associated DUF1156 domain-containing protein [Methanococcus maripaludis]